MPISGNGASVDGFGDDEYASPTRRRSPNTATASLTERKGREVSTAEAEVWLGISGSSMVGELVSLGCVRGCI